MLCKNYNALLLKLHRWDTDSKSIPKEAITNCADTVPVATAASLGTKEINRMKIENHANIAEFEIPPIKLDLQDPPCPDLSKLLHNSNFQFTAKHNSKINIQFPGEHDFNLMKSSHPLSILSTDSDCIRQTYKEKCPIKGTAVHLMF